MRIPRSSALLVAISLSGLAIALLRLGDQASPLAALGPLDTAVGILLAAGVLGLLLLRRAVAGWTALLAGLAIGLGTSIWLPSALLLFPCLVRLVIDAHRCDDDVRPADRAIFSLLMVLAGLAIGLVAGMPDLLWDRPVAVARLNRAMLAAQGIDLADPAAPAGRLDGPQQDEESLRANEAAPAWSENFELAGIDGLPAMLVWLGGLTAMALAALPLVTVACRRLPDRGLLLVRPAGFLLVGWLAWLLASVRLLPFGRGTVLAAIGTVALASLVVLLVDHRLRGEIVAHWRQLLGAEALFLAGFGAMAGVRMFNPDLWMPGYGGEKPMDLAILTATSRTIWFPPTDPWFSGGILNYYYLGQALFASLIRLTGIPPETGYNLAIATLFGMTACAAYGLGANLAVLTGRGERRGIAGALTLILVAVAGNLDAPIQVIGGLLRDSGPAFDYWNSSRMMPEQNTITEFPAFTFLFADLHAHLIALPVGLLALGLGLAVAVGGGWQPALLLGLVVGSLRAINGWDYPTYLALALGAAALPLLEDVNRAAVARSVGIGLLLIATGWAAFLPFSQHFQLFYRFVTISPGTTPIHQYLAIHAAMLFPIVSLLALALWHAGGRALLQRGNWALGLVLVVWVGVALAGLVTVAATVLLAILTVWATWRFGPAGSRAASGYLVLLVSTGLLIGAAVDLVTIAGDPTRTNTVFKFYFQAWVLLSVGAAQATVRLVSQRTGVRKALTRLWLGAGGLLLGATLLWTLMAIPARVAQRLTLLPPTLDGMAYLRSAVYQDERGPIDLSADLAAIDWLREHGGLRPILEGRTPVARWGGRFSVHTGMPAVLGWDFHQREQRRAQVWQVDERAQDVDRFYASGDPSIMREVLRRYQPAYVALGELEERFYPASGLAALRALEGSVLDVAYQNPRVTIYRVRLQP
ncbi:MAG: DUF2298 domain-containing protein [Dehalococcoidia bacterium]